MSFNDIYFQKLCFGGTGPSLKVYWMRRPNLYKNRFCYYYMLFLLFFVGLTSRFATVFALQQGLVPEEEGEAEDGCVDGVNAES